MNIIYVDVLITVNLFVDYLLLFSVKKLLHIHTKQIRILLGALFSALTAPIIFLPFYTETVSLFFKPLISSATVLVSFGFSEFRKFIIRTGTLWGLSMGLCGALVAVEYLLNPKKLIIYRDTMYIDISPISLVLFTLIAYLILTVYDNIKSRQSLNCNTVTITIQTDDKKKLSFESAVDTGLTLREPFSGLPVIMVEKSVLANIDIPKERKRVIPFHTASGDDMVYGFKPQKLLLNGIEPKSECYVAIIQNKLKGEIKSLIGEELLESI